MISEIMIQFLSDNIDQLDLALDQLAVSDRNFDRFALMLIDNVVELTLHRFIQDCASENEMWEMLDKSKHDPRIIQKALGQNFDSKVKASRSLGLLDPPLCDSILNLHSFRNTSYHRGLRHEGILHSLAIFYFSNACEVLKLYKPRSWSWGSSDNISYRVIKYVGNTKNMGQEEIYRAAYCRLGEVATSMGDNLVKNLSEDMEKTIETVDEDINFLANNGPQKITRDEVVIETQVWAYSFTDEAKEFAKEHGCKETTMGGFIDWISDNYLWQVKGDPVDNWRIRLDNLSKENDNHKALKRYCDFMKQTETIRSQLEESASHLDGHIQQQIDLMRGK